MEKKVFVDKSINDEKIVGIEENGYRWYLNSRYDAGTVANVWAQQVEGDDEISIFVIFGLANGMYAKCLSDRYSSNTIVIYEPCPEIYDEFEKDIELSAMEESDRIIIITDEKLLYATLGGIIDYMNCKYVKYMVLPDYDKIYPLESVKLEKDIAELMQKQVFLRNTLLRFENVSGKNLLKNMMDAFSHNTVLDMIKGLKQYKNRAAVIVSAGPSLDKNVAVLRKVKNKVLIICVDSAVKTMIREGILPDVIVTIDPSKSISRFSLEEIQKVPLVCDIYFNHRITEVYDSQRFYSFSPNTYVGGIIENNALNYLDTGGSVANTAFSMALRIGFTKIVLVGQDLSYPSGKKHADAGNISKSNQINENRMRYYKVEAYNGGTVTTETNMNYYRKWFEKVIEKRKDVTVFNATEGGAMIHGATNITLEEFSKEYCTSLENVDFIGEIHNIPKHFTEDEKAEKIKAVMSIKDNGIDDILKNISECKKFYEEFNKLNLKGKYTTGRFRTVTQKIIELQKSINEAPEREWLEKYNVLNEYLLMDTILEKKSTPYEENKEIYDKGIKLMEVYEEAIDMFLKDYEEATEDWR